MTKSIREQLVRFRVLIQFLVIFAFAFAAREYFQRIGTQEALRCIAETAQHSCDAYALDGWLLGWVAAIIICLAGSGVVGGRYFYARNRKRREQIA